MSVWFKSKKKTKKQNNLLLQILIRLEIDRQLINL